ncbi:hypothetical protein C1H46_015453 [Malus baccata]|uniref:F-box domain-containing protein n=1 Tax=Malus baccata TaxID=106549 RepID=A0A540MJ48_MALBA|nr:hypothetical protein C1H46_015453 [Malus baccata]
MMKKGRTTSSSMQFVFDDVLLKVLIIVAFHSLMDLFLASKKFKEIAEDRRLYQHINITNFETIDPFRSWGASNKVLTFINRCIQCRNPEAL